MLYSNTYLYNTLTRARNMACARTCVWVHIVASTVEPLLARHLARCTPAAPSLPTTSPQAALNIQFVEWTLAICFVGWTLNI